MILFTCCTAQGGVTAMLETETDDSVYLLYDTGWCSNDVRKRQMILFTCCMAQGGVATMLETETDGGQPVSSAFATSLSWSC